MTLPSQDELLEFYNQWYEENFCRTPAKPSPAVLHFALAAIERYGATASGSDA